MIFFIIIIKYVLMNKNILLKVLMLLLLNQTLCVLSM